MPLRDWHKIGLFKQLAYFEMFEISNLKIKVSQIQVHLKKSHIANSFCTFLVIMAYLF